MDFPRYPKKASRTPFIARGGPRLLVAQNVDEGVVLLRGDQLDHYWILRGLCCEYEEEEESSGGEEDYMDLDDLDELI